MESFFIGLLVIFLGGVLTFLGYQAFRVIIPLWGFFAGFSWGAQAVSVGLGGGFLATVTGWGIGLFLGLLIAALAYMFYEFAVAVLAGSVGYWLTLGFFGLFGIEAGFFITMLGWAAGIALGVAALYLKAPKGLLIMLTAFAGATAVIGGLLVMFGVVPVAALGSNIVSAIIQQSFLWTVSWIALAMFGAASQAYVSSEISAGMSSNYPLTSTPLTGVKGGTSEKTTTTDEVNEEV